MGSEFPLELRVLVLAPTRRDGEITLRLLADADMHGVVCGVMGNLIAELRRGAGVVVLTDHGHDLVAFNELRTVLCQQESWSELPVVALARPGSTSPHELRSLPGLVLLERPVQTRTLLSAVEAALRARQRQYRLRDQLEEIQSANARLAESTRAKDHFLAILAHELRNPLSALASSAHLLRMETDDEQVRIRAQQVMQRQIEQMTRLLDDLLDVSRITTNKVQLQRDTADLNELARTALETARPLMEARQHQLSSDLEPGPLHVFVDPVRITQVLGNLLANAAKYTEAGGKIEVTTRRIAGKASLTVRDNGVGIPADCLDSVFGMFSQLHPALEGARGGLGIGLALAKGIVSLHEGSLTAHSEGVGRGSEFVMELPLPSGTVRGVSSNQMARHDSVAPLPRRILVADDNVDGLETLAEALRLEGHTVGAARDGSDAAEQFATFHPEVAILDIGMPGMNGYELARQVRAGGNQSVTLVALTGWGQAADRALAFEAGFNHHLTKPVDMAQLRAVLGASITAPDGRMSDPRRKEPQPHSG